MVIDTNCSHSQNVKHNTLALLKSPSQLTVVLLGWVILGFERGGGGLCPQFDQESGLIFDIIYLLSIYMTEPLTASMI